MNRIRIITGLLTIALASGCATEPMGPAARVMPAQGKPFEVFAAEQATCKQFAQSEVGGGAMLSNLQELGAAALSTALGAGMGAAIPIHNHARGAEIGGSLGAMTGTMLASRGAARDQQGLQGRYDLAYTQCMYARGNQVAAAAPGPARMASGARGGYPTAPGAGPNAPGGQAEYGTPWTR
jgi:hypothetical protein